MFEELVITIIAMLPIVEARLAVPMAIDFGLSYGLGWLYAFLGSSVICPIILAVFLPLINRLKKTKLFKKAATVIFEKFEKKSRKIKTDDNADGDKKRKFDKATLKKALGVFTFVAIPLPLTGVWTGSAVAAIVKLSYPIALVAVIAGNMVASLLILLLTVLFKPYVNVIITVIGVIAIVVVIALILKIIFHKDKSSLMDKRRYDSDMKKIAVILCDGMADYTNENGSTPMLDANKPNIDFLAKSAEVGLIYTVPKGMKPGSDVANLSVLGFDPRNSYTGRSPLEAISLGISLSENDVTYRANLVTLSNESEYQDKTMVDYSAGEISSLEASQLIKHVASHLKEYELFAGVSYRHCLVKRNGTVGAVLTPPHDISDKKIAEYLPSGENATQLLDVMKKSHELLKDHPINIERVKKGLNPANSLWLWGEGTKPKLEDFQQKFGLKGAMISAVDLLKGIAIGANMKSIDVQGATGNVNTNWQGKADATVKAIKEHDFVYVHIEAPDECGHQGDYNGKVKSIELIDKYIVSSALKALNDCGEPFALIVVPDHATPIKLKTHVDTPVPYLIYKSNVTTLGVDNFNELTAKTTQNVISAGYDLLPHVLGEKD